MIDISTKIHDQFSIEFKVGFVTRRKLRHNDFSVYMWIFVPNSLDINPSTYSKSNFYRDVKSNIRLITPRHLMRDIAVGEESPAERLRQAMKRMASDPTRSAKAEYESQIKIFSAIVKSALREEVQHIQSGNQSYEDVRFLCKTYRTNAEQILSTYRSLRQIINTPTITSEVAGCFHYGDEFMSYSLNNSTFRLIKWLMRDRERYSYEIKLLADMLHQEEEYRKQMNYLIAKRDDKLENRDLIYSHGVLKKYVESALYLRAPKKRDGVMVEQIYLSIAAGLSMIFATIISFYFQQRFGNFTWPFFIVLVISYMGKDRIKELARYYFAHRKGNKYYDNKANISIGERTIGWIKEGVDFLQRNKVPEEVLRLRKLHNITPAEQFTMDDKVLLYRKWVHIDREQLVAHNVYHTDGINDIIRLNVNNLIQKMDNPYVSLPRLDENDNLYNIDCKKVYFLNIVMQYQYDGKTEYKRFRVSLSRAGIESIKEIDYP
ncbi:MAG: hypothetical protein UHY58_06560 [Alistipes sp.]|nr:hypothetical protein [Alistipes sp.]